MVARRVIVFGATGAVGAAAARTAHEHGAAVVLAMRDTSKAVPALEGVEVDKVYADLTKPDSIRSAAATHTCDTAFLYAAEQSSDHMRASIEALQVAGVTFVVFLSSFTVQANDVATTPPEQATAYMHAMVEANLLEVFGRDAFVALRPGPFASNVRQYVAGIKTGEVKVFLPEAKVDFIAPEDIGRVAGVILATGTQDGEHAVVLLGPQIFTQQEVVELLANILGKQPTIVPATEDEAFRMYVEGFGAPEAAARDMIDSTKRTSANKTLILGTPIDRKDMANIERYTGRKSTTLEEWIRNNKQQFVI